MDAALRNLIFFRDMQLQMLMVTDEDLSTYAPCNEIAEGSRSIGFLGHEMKTLWVVTQKAVRAYQDLLGASVRIPHSDPHFEESLEKEKKLRMRANSYRAMFNFCLEEEFLPKTQHGVKTLRQIKIAITYEVFVVTN